MTTTLLLILLPLLLTPLALQSSSLPLQLLSLKSSLRDPLSHLHDWIYAPNGSARSKPAWCSWTGVTCDAATGTEVYSLDLSSKNLSGSIAPEIRLLCRSLVHLNLSGNSFDGPFPSAIFSLRRLQTLDISRNNFNSTFPAGISKLAFLTLFDAYSNSFAGPVPRGIANLEQLQHLNLGGSFFEGRVPAALGGLKKLRYLHIAGNLLGGRLPSELGLLPLLEHLEIGYNKFEGDIPAEWGRLSNLVYLDIASANLSGPLPTEIANNTRLESMFLFKNRLSGAIPARYSDLKALKVLDLSDNRLSGSIPVGFSSLYNLTLLSLMNNELSGDIPEGIGVLPSLETLLLWNNSLTGILPQELGSNGKLEKLDVSSNSLTGPLPSTLCYGNRLVRLILFSNRFDSGLPPSLAKCESLWRIRIEKNRLSGSIPLGFGLLPNLTYMDASLNNFSGELPRDLGNATRLELLNVSGNPLRSSLSDTLWSSASLQIFSASYCGLRGKIPNFEFGCRSLYKLELGGNALRGSIPWDIGRCQKLLSLKLDQNRLTGIIPWQLAALPSITDVDLSRNELSGTIPSSFDNCSTLESFNVSYNLLTGSVPSSGAVFKNLHPSSFLGNRDLCGASIGRPCRSDALQEFESPAKRSAGAGIVWITAGAFVIGVLVLIAGARCFHNRRLGDEDVGGCAGPWKLTAFQRLNFTAEDVAECVAASDKIIGMGSTGAVYRAEMPGGGVIAVKKLWGKQKEIGRAARRMLAEVEVLGSVRHRNIVRLLGCCSNRDTTLLLYEYMPNGSLDDLLHRRNKKGEEVLAAADWLTRYKIALGVAQGISYLHHDCEPVIVHRDLKPSNILLDGEMEARVADFGVAKLIQTDESMSVVAGSYGYIAPEYAYTLQVDEKSDIYSYGVVLMEIVSGRRSVEAEFGEGNGIVEWVRSKVRSKEGAWEVLDRAAGAGCSAVREEMMLVLRVALLCTSRSPGDRPSMRDVVSMLEEAKPKRKTTQQKLTSGGGDGKTPAGEHMVALADS